MSHSTQVFEHQEFMRCITTIKGRDKRTQRFKLVKELKTRPFIKDMPAADLRNLNDEGRGKIWKSFLHTVTPDQVAPPIVREDLFGQGQFQIRPGMDTANVKRGLGDLGF